MTAMIPAVMAAAEVAAPALSGNVMFGLACTGSGIGIGLVGAKMVEAIGRNPGAQGKILTIGLLGIALAESITIYAMVFMFLGK
ncbi:MAG: ATP synthase F0 subunit C [Chthoniobacteraceae bacterium]